MTIGVLVLPSFNAKFSIIDISPCIHENLAVWPGDTAFKRKRNLQLRAGDNIDLSEITTTLHIGAHADAPSHYALEQDNMDQIDLTPYIGPCQVIEIDIARGRRIQPEDIQVEITAPRVLFKTSSYPNPNHFNTDFNSFSKELVDYMATKECILMGIDTPSVDLFDDKILESHKQFLEYQIRNIEGIILEHVAAGEYFLSAAPLHIEGADAAPMRAVLLDFYTQQE